MKYLLTLSFLALLSAPSISQDWAELSKYKEENKSILDANSDENRVVFMGNSITEGWVNQRPEFFVDNPYIGRGISGQTTPQMLIRMRQDVVNLNPSVVVILAGTNDIAGNTGPMTLDETLDNIKSMADIATSNGIRVILSSVLPVYDYPWKPGLEPNIKIPKLNSMIKSYAAQADHIYLDYFTAMADKRNGLPKRYAEDEVHPTVLGYKVMEPLVKSAIEKALK